MQVELNKGELHVSIPMYAKQPTSKSGKSKIFASSGGNKRFNVDIGGGKTIELYVGIVAYQKIPESSKNGK